VYLPPAFAVADTVEIAEMITAAGTGHVVSAHDDGMQASFVPLLLDRERNLLRGHVACANPHARTLMERDSTPVLVIFTGVESYVSPSWYPTKADTGKVVPTWNYELVHVHGTLRVTGDVEQIVRDLTDHHEAGREQPWSVDDAPADYVSSMLRAIAPIEISIDRVEAKRKLSQNRPVADIVGVISNVPEAGMAQAMQRANMRDGVA
jgi:transcriptional regulator